MKSWLRRSAFMAPLGLLAAAARSQVRPRRSEEEEPASDLRLPNGKMQREELIKHEYEQNLKDVDLLIDTAKGLKAEMEKNTHYVLSIGTIKKTEEIEKLARKIRTRMQRF